MAPITEKGWLLPKFGRLIVLSTSSASAFSFTGVSYMDEYPLAWLKADYRVARIYGGANAMMK